MVKYRFVPGTSFQFFQGGDQILTDFLGGGGGKIWKQLNCVCKNKKATIFQIQGGGIPPPQMTSLVCTERMLLYSLYTLMLGRGIVGRRRGTLLPLEEWIITTWSTVGVHSDSYCCCLSERPDSDNAPPRPRPPNIESSQVWDIPA